jgi:hypothetical protein
VKFPNSNSNSNFLARFESEAIIPRDSHREEKKCSLQSLRQLKRSNMQPCPHRPWYKVHFLFLWELNLTRSRGQEFSRGIHKAADHP